MENKLVIFDAFALIYRAYHAMPPLTSKDGQPISAIYGLTSMLLTVIDLLKPTHIIFAFDELEKTFRNKLLDSYQAQRKETPEELSSQFPKSKELIKALKIPMYFKAGFEADDVIGTIANLVSKKENNFEVIVVTGDRDILQIVDDSKNVKLFMPISGMSNGKIFKETETIERMGVRPDQIPDYKALVGDPSDNYFGISGIGPKTAINLLEKFENIDGIYKNTDSLPEKVKTKLIDGRESCMLSLKLATIVKDVPIDFDVNDSANWDFGSKEVLELFERYGFKTLTNRIKSLSKKIESEKQGNLF